MNRSRINLLFLFSLIFLFGCEGEVDESWKYDAMGELGDVALLTDQVSWSEYAPLIDSMFAQQVPGVAGVEPFFVIRRCDEAKFDDYYKKNYNLFVFIHRERWQYLKPLFNAKMQEKIESKFNPDGLVVFRANDVWAKPQQVHFVLMPNDKVMQETLRNKRASFLNQALDAERLTTVTSLISGSVESDTFRNSMLKKYGYAFRKPSTYNVSLRSNEVNGISRYMNAKKVGFYFFEENYTSENQFSPAAIIARRNNILKNHIKGTDRPDSIPTFMGTDTVNVKLFRRQYNINGMFVVETRGWWQMENDYMAGPFVNYTFLVTKTNKIVTLDGSVFAPGHEKHKLIRQIELIAHTFEAAP